MQEGRWAFIIRQLCVLLNAEDIYRTLAAILIEEEDYRFARVMVETLSTLLLTSAELFSLRRKLKDLDSKVDHRLIPLPLPRLEFLTQPHSLIVCPGELRPIRYAVQVLESQCCGHGGPLPPQSKLRPGINPDPPFVSKGCFHSSPPET